MILDKDNQTDKITCGQPQLVNEDGKPILFNLVNA